MVDAVEARPTHPNALAKRLYSERFFGDNLTPSDLITQHEKWLITELEACGVPVDNRTWSNFYNSAVNRSLDQKNAKPTGKLQQQTFKSVENILQALAWYHYPEGASWKTPEISFQLQSPIFVDHDRLVKAAKLGRRRNDGRWFSPSEEHKSDLVGFGSEPQDDTEFIFQVNEHYEGVQGWFYRKDGTKLHGVEGQYDCRTNILKISFANPNDFMGWQKTEDRKQYVEEDRSKLVYTLEYLNQFLVDLITAVSEQKSGAIAVETWRAC